MRQVIKHRDIRLLNMIRRTDPEIHLFEIVYSHNLICSLFKFCFSGAGIARASCGRHKVRSAAAAASCGHHKVQSVPAAASCGHHKVQPAAVAASCSRHKVQSEPATASCGRHKVQSKPAAASCGRHKVQPATCGGVVWSQHHALGLPFSITCSRLARITMLFRAACVNGL